MNKNNFMKGALATAGSIATMATFASAQTTNTGALGPSGPVGKNLQDLVALVQSLIGPITGILIAVTVIVFFYELIRFMTVKDGKAKTDAIKYMGLAILILFVEVSIWGLVTFLGSAIGVSPTTKVPTPQVPIRTGVYDGVSGQTY